MSSVSKVRPKLAVHGQLPKRRIKVSNGLTGSLISLVEVKTLRNDNSLGLVVAPKGVRNFLQGFGAGEIGCH